MSVSILHHHPLQSDTMEEIQLKIGQCCVLHMVKNNRQLTMNKRQQEKVTEYNINISDSDSRQVAFAAGASFIPVYKMIVKFKTADVPGNNTNYNNNDNDDDNTTDTPITAIVIPSTIIVTNDYDGNFSCPVWLQQTILIVVQKGR